MEFVKNSNGECFNETFVETCSFRHSALLENTKASNCCVRNFFYKCLDVSNLKWLWAKMSLQLCSKLSKIDLLTVKSFIV